MPYKQICPHCKEEIPPQMVQQGGLHLGCSETEIDVFFISLPRDPKSGFYEEDADQLIEMLKHIEESHRIERRKIYAGIYHNMPDFEGF